MKKAAPLIFAMLTVMSFSTVTLADSQVLTFDTNNWGTGIWGTYNTIKNFESSGGNPGACLLLKGISGVGGSFVNAGFTGDFAAGGYSRIAFDIKIKHWFPTQGQPAPKAYVFVRKGIAHDPWCRQIQDFSPVTTAWKRYSVDFNPDWSDAEAQANGWNIIHFNGTSQTSPFSETLHNVFQTGMWISVVDGGAECHIFLDNYSLLQESGTGALSPIQTNTIKKSVIKRHLKNPEPVKTKP